MVHVVRPVTSIVGIKFAQDLVMNIKRHSQTRLTLVLALLTAAFGAHAENLDIWDKAAKKTGISKQTIQSICINESGIGFNDGYRRAWPYVLNSKYGPMFFHHKEQASEMLSKLISMGVKNVDIGMCQMNMAHQGHRVKSPHDLLDPVTNLETASDYLKELMQRYNGNVVDVVAAYHTGSLVKPEQQARGVLYVNSVINIQGKLTK